MTENLKETLDALCLGARLSREQAKSATLAISSGACAPELVASFLTVFRMRHVTVDEILGFRDCLLELAIKPNLSEFQTVDLCGTGGDGKDTFNISTLAAFVAAGAGVKVAKHGNVSVSSACGSSDVLLALGAKFTADEDILRAQLEQASICYLHAPLFHPAMKNVAPIRKALGVRTFFNLLGPLVNPALPKAQIVGVFSGEIARLFHFVLAECLTHYLVLHSLDGYDEISLTSDVRLSGPGIEGVFSPRGLGFSNWQAEHLRGGPVQESAELFMKILSGNGSKAQNEVVMANAAAAIAVSYALLPSSDGRRVTLDSLKEAKKRAEESLFSKAAERCFRSFIEISNQR